MSSCDSRTFPPHGGPILKTLAASAAACQECSAGDGSNTVPPSPPGEPRPARPKKTDTRPSRRDLKKVNRQPSRGDAPGFTTTSAHEPVAEGRPIPSGSGVSHAPEGEVRSAVLGGKPTILPPCLLHFVSPLRQPNP